MKHSTQEFFELIKTCDYMPLCGKFDFMFPSRYYYMENISIFVSNGVIWFSKCCYCGATDKYVIKNLLDQDCCGHCNAPILWDDYQ